MRKRAKQFFFFFFFQSLFIIIFHFPNYKTIQSYITKHNPNRHNINPSHPIPKMPDQYWNTYTARWFKRVKEKGKKKMHLKQQIFHRFRKPLHMVTYLLYTVTLLRLFSKVGSSHILNKGYKRLPGRIKFLDRSSNGISNLF